METKNTATQVFNSILMQPGAVRLFALFGSLNVAVGLVVTLNGSLKMASISLIVGIAAIGVAFYSQHLRTTTPLRYFRPVAENFAAMLKVR